MTVKFGEVNTNKLGLYVPLSKNGDKVTFSAIENYADSGGTAPQGLTKFFIAPPEDEIWFINRMIIQIRDTGSLDAESYGNGLKLTNGVRIFQEDKDANNILDMMFGLSVDTNAGWGIWAFNTYFSSYGSGDEFLTVEWSFARFGVPIVLQGDPEYGHKLVATFNDDLSGLNEHFFFCHGWIETHNSDGKPIPYRNRQ